MTSFFIIISAFLSTYCVNQLVDAGIATRLLSYSLIVEQVFGKKGRFGLDVMVSFTQFSVTIAGVIFLIKTWQVTFDYLFTVNSNPWIYGCIIICIYSPIACVRDIGKFSFTFMLGNLLILLAVVYVTVYCFMTIARLDEIAPEIKFINTDSYLSTLGFSVYCFEGIGIVMPIMQACEDPSTFKSSLNWAISILTVIYIIFGSIGYLTWG